MYNDKAAMKSLDYINQSCKAIRQRIRSHGSIGSLGGITIAVSDLVREPVLYVNQETFDKLKAEYEGKL